MVENDQDRNETDELMYLLMKNCSVNSINTSMLYYNVFNKVFGDSAEDVIICIYSLLMIFGIVSNIFIIFIITFTKKLTKYNNILLVNLLVTNLSICLFNMPDVPICSRDIYFCLLSNNCIDCLGTFVKDNIK